VAVLLADLADRRGVDDRHHLLQVIQEQPVEQRLVAVVEPGEEQISPDVVGGGTIVLVGSALLILRRRDRRRQNPVETQFTALLRGEAGPLVQDRILREGRPATSHRHVLLSRERIDALFESLDSPAEGRAHYRRASTGT
jgi:hypothetical protein